MIRINRKGLSEAEEESIQFPLSSNNQTVLDITNIGPNLEEAWNRYGTVMEEVVEAIDRDGPPRR